MASVLTSMFVDRGGRELRRTRNQRVSRMLARVGIRLDRGGTVPQMLVWLLLCFVAYPISWFGDRFLAHADRGYTLIVEAVRWPRRV